MHDGATWNMMDHGASWWTMTYHDASWCIMLQICRLIASSCCSQSEVHNRAHAPKIGEADSESCCTSLPYPDISNKCIKISTVGSKNYSGRSKTSIQSKMAARRGARRGRGGGGVPKMVSLINNWNKQSNRKSETTLKTKIRLVIYHDLLLFYQEVKMILWSIHTFWYKGLAEQIKKWQVRGKEYISQKTAQTIRLIFRKRQSLVVGGQYWVGTI